MQVHQNVSFMRDSISSGVTFIKEGKNNTRNWSWLCCQNFLKNVIGWGNKAYDFKRYVHCQNKITIGRKLNPWQDGKSNSISTFGYKFMRTIRDCKSETSTGENNGKLIAPLQNDMDMTKETYSGVRHIYTSFPPQVMYCIYMVHSAPKPIWCNKNGSDGICSYFLIEDIEAEHELHNKEVKEAYHNRSEVQSKTEANRKYQNDVTVQKHEGLAIIRALKQCRTSIITKQPCFEVDMGSRPRGITDKKITSDCENCSYSFEISGKNDTTVCTIELGTKSKLSPKYTLVNYTRTTPFKTSESSQSTVYYGIVLKKQNVTKPIKTVDLLTDCSNMTKQTATEMFDGLTDENSVALSQIFTVNSQMSEFCNINIAAKQKHQIRFRGKYCWNDMEILFNEHQAHLGNFHCTNIFKCFKTIFVENCFERNSNDSFLINCDEIDTNTIFARLNLQPIALCSSGRFNKHVEVDGHVIEQTQPFLKLCQHISFVKPFHLKIYAQPKLVGCFKSVSRSKHCKFPKHLNIVSGTPNIKYITTKSPSKIDNSVNNERQQALDKPSFDQVCIQLKYNQLLPSYIEKHIHSECTEAPVTTINTVVVDSADKATQNIVDLKHKHVFRGNRNSCFDTKIKTCDQNKTKCLHEKGSFTSDLKIVVDDIKTKRSHGKGSFTCDHKSYVDDIRALTWLPLDQLPVPEVDITVALLFDPLDTIFQQMARGDTPGPEITMRYELLRLCTLRNYPKNNKPYIIRLAGAGFYYAAEGDEVVCYCCGIRMSSWTENKVPLEIHRRESPSCSFLTRNSQVNIRVPEPEGPSTDKFAFIEDPAESSNQVQSSINGTFSSNDRISQGISTSNSAITRHRVPGNFSRISTVNSNNTRTRAPAGNFVCSNYQTQIATTTSHHSSTPPDVNTTAPKHPTYAVKSVRSASFERWPLTTGQTPEVMADAGYYYAGIEDAVRCFHCGIGLRHWTPDDNPYIEHARWSRNCVYLKLVKGEEFISLVHLAMQYTDDNEEQTGATGGAASQIPVDEINKILLTDAGQSVLEMGYQPKTIKQAIEEILKDSGKPGISSSTIMAKVLEMEERRSFEELAKQTGHLEIKSQGSNEQTKTQNVPSKTDTNTKKSQIADNSTGKHAASIRKDPKAIKAENDKMEKQTLCKVCMNNTVCIVFLPCGHFVTCAKCAPAMRKCPICRTLVKGTVKAFMS